MKNVIRWILGFPVAALVTVGLFVLMMTLIAEEFKPQEKLATASFDINPTVEDIKVIKRDTKVKQVKKVVTPPPPPTIERQQAAKPQERIASLEGAIPDFEAPKIDRKNFKIAVSDRDAQPLVRIPPIMPPRAEKSGHCRVKFDVSPEGAPFNVMTTFCTQRLFERATIKSVQRWKYNPKIVDGRAVARNGVENKVTYRLTDERGRIIPE
ncbi:energy transducer TonB [Hellea sp.]|jgi:protein TonB|nr:energy transducer TonB [Hellea sp.]MBT7398551.1 energy transducer TonB [Hellea sp.]MDA8888065.1 energy transducer TonB [Hellea sp.]MDB4844991.1 energy transducer TonB [Hellea sp.]MDC0421439.1 energy transducer TonB [Hellea sp.]MDC1061479.1 energy transducer TonB [Hellea sp.]